MDGAFANSQDTGAVKALVRLHHLPVLKPERKTLWKAILDKRMDEKRGFPDAPVNHKEMYDDTLVSCFGAKGKFTSTVFEQNFACICHTSVAGEADGVVLSLCLLQPVT